MDSQRATGGLIANPTPYKFGDDPHEYFVPLHPPAPGQPSGEREIVAVSDPITLADGTVGRIVLHRKATT